MAKRNIVSENGYIEIDDGGIVFAEEIAGVGFGVGVHMSDEGRVVHVITCWQPNN